MNPPIFTIEEENLICIFDVTSRDALIAGICGALPDFDDPELREIAEGSLLGEFDDFNLGVAFENALANSIAYTLMSRCGFDTADTALGRR